MFAAPTRIHIVCILHVFCMYSEVRIQILFKELHLQYSDVFKPGAMYILLSMTSSGELFFPVCISLYFVVFWLSFPRHFCLYSETEYNIAWWNTSRIQQNTPKYTKIVIRVRITPYSGAKLPYPRDVAGWPPGRLVAWEGSRGWVARLAREDRCHDILTSIGWDFDGFRLYLALYTWEQA